MSLLSALHDVEVSATVCWRGRGPFEVVMDGLPPHLTDVSLGSWREVETWFCDKLDRDRSEEGR